jgi:2-polyprenyl-3-methyl-5-hydroxy-6-metoxy-1,4-benzoquinol methylase
VIDAVQAKVENYFRGQRINVAELIKTGSHRVLDVGCGVGNFGAYLKQTNRANEVIGLEINQQAAEEAKLNLDGVYCLDLNRVDVKECLPKEDTRPFDYITCNDVLEHLVDPWAMLVKLTEYLAEDGKIVVSLPNVRHWSVWMPLLLRGRWDYQDAGIMDRTHLRFFTQSTMQDLFDSANLIVIEKKPLIGGKWKFLNKLLFNSIQDFVAVQWLFVVTRRKQD